MSYVQLYKADDGLRPAAESNRAQTEGLEDPGPDTLGRARDWPHCEQEKPLEDFAIKSRATGGWCERATGDLRLRQ